MDMNTCGRGTYKVKECRTTLLTLKKMKTNWLGHNILLGKLLRERFKAKSTEYQEEYKYEGY